MTSKLIPAFDSLPAPTCNCRKLFSESLKPGSHERHEHKDKINTKTKHISSGTCEDKTRIFLCFVFCSALGLRLDYDLMLMITTILMSQARLNSFVLPLVLSLCLCVNQALVVCECCYIRAGDYCEGIVCQDKQ